MSEAPGELYALRRRVAELEKELAALKSVAPLGLLTVCASCKKILAQDGFWTEMEQYLTTRAGAECSHSVCPTCAARLYGDLEG